ncbi:uncharacterized protein LOC115442492 [Manduca sexta]|uniref:Cuticle protein n=1 Tax=Manduca sexta TaxID=7130 RepID=A0A921Z089_MANSE|nr:uncharacterized protein LOC115442492 [Manduca sexta]KAG6448601.1 hypothetical protein O3G_MSEX005584 [Manduca sexta]
MIKHELLLLICACCSLAALDGYSPQQDPNQFHIQTDEDDERYFLYQTHNGQYRKERRLKDGSVVGSTGWVGADGYLRLQDYIADNQGYRIYRSKTVFVGQDRPISESLDIAKTAPTDPGYGVTPAPAVQRTTAAPRVTSTTPSPAQSSSKPTNNFPSDVSITPAPYYPHPTSTPRVHVSPNSIDSSTPYELNPTETPASGNEVTTTPNPYYYDSSNTLDDYYASDSRHIDVFNPNSYRHADDWVRRQRPNVPIGDGYTPQFAMYNGIGSKNNGFRYYLPKQYHEEETDASDDRTGSFGYVDPFGIRRVIYYNTAPGEGFHIRKNNRYVGHDATPYDPRPIN